MSEHTKTDHPARTPDTMSDAIALSSPNGRMSNRSRKAAERRLSLALFGPGGLVVHSPGPLSRVEAMRQQAARLRGLADRGMNTRKNRREADGLDAEILAEGGQV